MNPFSTKRGGPRQLLKVSNARLRFLTPDEAKGLLAELNMRNPSQLHDMALLSLRTGLWAAEIFKLKGQDVDAHAGVLYVIGKGGTRVAVRVPQDMIAMFRGYNRKPSEPLFKTSMLGEAFKKTPPSFGWAVKALKLAPEDGDSLYAVTFHTLRHTFASWPAQSGKVTLIELKNLMRHKNINTTLRYAHLIPGQEQGWASENNPRYTINDQGEVMRRQRQPAVKPRDKAASFESSSGEKSAQRIAEERGHAVIQKAQSWKELHEGLAKAGLRFERKGSGAVVLVGDTVVKASSIAGISA